MAGSNYLDVLLAQQGGGRSFLGDVGAINDAAAKRKRESAADQLLRSTMERANQEAEQARIDEALAGVEADKREALREQVAKTPNAVVVNGVVYSGANAGQQAHEDFLRQKAKEKVAESNATALALLQKDRDTQIKEINEKKRAFAEGKVPGIDSADLTPENIAIVQANLDKALADIDAKYQQAAEGAPSMPDPNAGQMLESLKAQRDQVQELSDKLRGTSESYGMKHNEFVRGVDAETKDLLEQMLVDNPFQAPSDPRRFDRFREQSIQRSMPDLLTAAKVDPTGAKLIMDQYKLDSKQGDSAIEAERKTYNAGKKNYNDLLTKTMALKDNLAKLTSEKSRFEEQLKLKRDELEEKIRNHKAKEEIDGDKNEIDRLLGLLAQNVRREGFNKAALASSVGRAAQNSMYYTDQGKAFTADMAALFQNVANSGNIEAIIDLINKFGPDSFQQKKEPASKTIGTKDGEDPLVGDPKKELVVKKEADPGNLPPPKVPDLTAPRDKKVKAGKFSPMSKDGATVVPNTEAQKQALAKMGYR